MIKKLSIKNFRGIEEVKDLEVDRFNIFIGDNGTSKTSILEAIHFCFSPNFLSGRIKHTDFPNGNDNPIKVLVELENSIKVNLPDGYTEQTVTCNKVFLGIKKRDKKTAGKIFSDLVTLDHIVVPDIPRGEKGYAVKRKNGSDFTFTERSLSLSQISTNELPRSFFFGKERDRQLQKGYNSSFSTIIDDLNWRFSRSVRKETEETGKPAEILSKIPSLTSEIADKIEFNKYEIFKEFNNRTKAFGIEEIYLTILDSIAPYESAFLSSKKDVLDLPIKYLGSGIEMIISLLFLETLASMSKEKLLILIDEPELHLHPRLQEQLADYLWKISFGNDGHQIFVTTHSPVFFKNCVGKSGVKTFVTNREVKTNKILVNEMSFANGLFPWSPSWGEINYFAYNYPTIEFHDELYGFIQEKKQCFSEQAMDNFLTNEGIKKSKKWTREEKGVSKNSYDVTLPVFIRNKIHHPENKTMQTIPYTNDELKKSIEILVDIVKKLK
ncbi:MAG: ATP-binding protein [Flavobacteriales bacterium]|jgi:predicted ATP-dependent endonuclease of OLD family|nr:ATP-binding protein [Flavobacteriales bacterium]